LPEKTSVARLRPEKVYDLRVENGIGTSQVSVSEENILKPGIVIALKVIFGPTLFALKGKLRVSASPTKKQLPHWLHKAGPVLRLPLSSHGNKLKSPWRFFPGCLIVLSGEQGCSLF